MKWGGGNYQASIDAMKTWNIHAVRIPLNEECWLGTSDVPSTGTSGAAYQQAVEDYVNLLVANGINVILDLHWTYGQYTGSGAGCSDVAASSRLPARPRAQAAAAGGPRLSIASPSPITESPTSSPLCGRPDDTRMFCASRIRFLLLS